MQTKNSQYWKERLPFIEAFTKGERVEWFHEGLWHILVDPGFNEPISSYRIAKPKERVPLEAEDWIKDGPWWYRSDEEDIVPVLVISVGPMSIGWVSSGSGHTHERAMRGQRRNAASDWMPCWKEKE